jgi:hypothetical protein
MQSIDRDQVSLHMDASPADVYALVADVTRMPEFSPEILSCTWLDGATGPAVGARFAARNQVAGFKWTNKPVVIATEAPRHFAISRTEKMGGTVEWHYRFEPDGEGTRVTESYEVTKRIPALGWFFIGLVARTKDRGGDMRRGMEQTLERMRAVVESKARSEAR